MSDLRFFDDVGEHGHRLLRNQKATASGGSHMHLWAVTADIELGDRKIRAGSLILSSWDGAHDHDMSADGLSLSSNGAHRHAVRLPGGRVEGTSKDGAHDHLVLVQRTGSGGPHVHELSVGGVALKSLTVADFLRLLAEEDAGESDMDDEVLFSLTPDPGCVHEDEAEKVACATVLMLERVTGKTVYGGPHNHVTPVVTKGVNDKMLNALERLSQE
jgi:hypothetical protein